MVKITSCEFRKEGPLYLRRVKPGGKVLFGFSFSVSGGQEVTATQVRGVLDQMVSGEVLSVSLNESAGPVCGVVFITGSAEVNFLRPPQVNLDDDQVPAFPIERQPNSGL